MEKTQEQIDRMRNLVWQNGKLIEQNQQLNEQNQQLLQMLAEKDDNAITTEITEAKKILAEAIVMKGGEASKDSSFSQLAEDILRINPVYITDGLEYDSKINFLKALCDSSEETKRNITEIDNDQVEVINNARIFYQCGNLKSIVLSNLKSLNSSEGFYNDYLLSNVDFPSLETLDGNYMFYGCTDLKSVRFPSLTSMNSNNTFSYSGLEVFVADNLTEMSYSNGTSPFRFANNLKEFIAPKLNRFPSNTQYLLSEREIRNVVVGKLENSFLFSNTKNTFVNLRNITIGVGTDIDLTFQYWAATNVINEGQSGIDELNSNLRTNLLEKLADHSTDGQTRTLRLGWLAKVSQENIDYANSKGWTLTT